MTTSQLKKSHHLSTLMCMLKSTETVKEWIGKVYGPGKVETANKAHKDGRGFSSNQPSWARRLYLRVRCGADVQKQLTRVIAIIDDAGMCSVIARVADARGVAVFLVNTGQVVSEGVGARRQSRVVNSENYHSYPLRASTPLMITLRWHWVEHYRNVSASR